MTRSELTTKLLWTWLAGLVIVSPVMGQFTLTVDSEPAEGGSTAVFPQAATYDDGAEVTLTATPAEGFEFAGWEGDVVAAESSITILMTDDTLLTAVFTEATPPGHVLTAFVDPSGAGTIVRDPAEFEYEDGAQVTLTAFAGEGFVFTGWEGDLPEGSDGSSAELTVVMNGDVTLEASFAAAQQLDDETATACGAMGMSGFGLMLSLMAAQYVGLRRRW